MMIKALEGKPLGRTLYGYQIGPDSRLEIIKSEATVVELIFRLYTQSEMGFRKIANHLNNERKIKFRKETFLFVNNGWECLPDHFCAEKLITADFPP